MAKDLDVIAFDLGGRHWEPGFTGLDAAQMKKKAELIARLWENTPTTGVVQRLYEYNNGEACVRLCTGNTVKKVTFSDEKQGLLEDILQYPWVEQTTLSTDTPRNPVLTASPPQPQLETPPTPVTSVPHSMSPQPLAFDIESLPIVLDTPKPSPEAAQTLPNIEQKPLVTEDRSKEIAALQKQLTEAHQHSAQNQTASNRLARKQQSIIDQLNKKLKEKEVNYNSLEARFKDASSELSSLQKMHGEMSSELTTKTTRLDRLSSEYRIALQKNTTLNKHAADFHRRISQLESDIRSHNASEKRDLATIRKLETERQQLMTEKETVEKLALETSREKELQEKDLEKTVRQLQLQLEAVQKEKEAQSKEAAEKIEALEQQILTEKHSRKKRSKQLEAALIEKQAKLNDSNEELNATRAALESATAGSLEIQPPVQKALLEETTSRLDDLAEELIFDTFQEIANEKGLDQLASDLTAEALAEAVTESND